MTKHAAKAPGHRQGAAHRAGAADLLLGAALDHPEKCLGVLSVEGLLKRHEALRAEGDKKRRIMETADALGLSVPQIYELSLGAMMAIEDELGL
jgi:predicted hydrolase (HD superfamily)